LFVARLESLPRKLAREEIHKHVTDRLQVVSSALFDAEVSLKRTTYERRRTIVMSKSCDMDPSACSARDRVAHWKLTLIDA
jgi:hypothetical protein